jgi:hypothetical protein
MTTEIKEFFSLTPPNDCKCNSSNGQKWWYIAGWALGITIYLFLLINSSTRWIINKFGFYLLLLSAIFLTMSMSGIIYFDACQCTESRYSKTFSFGYFGISLFMLIIFLLFSKLRNPPSYTYRY